MNDLKRKFQPTEILAFQSDGTVEKKGEKGKDGNGARRKSVGLVVSNFPCLSSLISSLDSKQIQWNLMTVAKCKYLSIYITGFGCSQEESEHI